MEISRGPGSLPLRKEEAGSSQVIGAAALARTQSAVTGRRDGSKAARGEKGGISNPDFVDLLTGCLQALPDTVPPQKNM